MSEFIIKKSFHFYAAHRNEDQPQSHPCYSIHGHTFYVDCYIALSSQGRAGVTVLFSDIEKAIKPVLDEFDHSLILNQTDSLCGLLRDQGIRLCLIDRPPSSENLSQILFERIVEATELDIVRLDFRETTSSVVTYLKPRSPISRRISEIDAVSAVPELA